jgi:hypothetical protein
LSQGHGKYDEVPGERELFEVCKKSNRVVCHFFRDTTMRCKIVDKHLTLLAEKHVETRFIKLNVERAPFLCERLHIRVLPTMAIILHNVTKYYIKGFDELGGTDDFTTEMLEWKLGCMDAISYSGNLLEPPSNKPKGTQFVQKKAIRSAHLSSDEDDD